ISNPIYIGVTFAPAVATPVASQSKPVFDGRTIEGWRTETDPASLAALDVVSTLTGTELRLRYGLSSGSSTGQYAAAAVELPNNAAPYDRVSFTARADSPLRLSIQFQPLGRAHGRQRSVYLDETARDYTVRFDDTTTIGSARAAWDPGNIHDMLF